MKKKARASGRMNRRELLKAGLATGAVLSLPGCLDMMGPGEAGLESHNDDYGGGDSFLTALPIPAVLQPVASDATTDYYEIEMRASTTQLRSGPATTVWTYNGTWPGPTIRARKGRTVQVRHTNNLTERMSVHLHGANTPPSSDGHPADYFQPGESKTYVYPNQMDAAPLWYHDHAVDFTGKHVMMGLAGFYLLTDDFEEGLGLPSGEYHVPLVFQDRKLDSNNQIVYQLDSGTIRSGFLGDIFCVNGAITPFFEVARHKYRFTLLNGSNARTYKLELSNGAAFQVIGSDGGLLTAPAQVTSLEIASAERFDIVIDFGAYPLGTSLVLRDRSSSNGLVRFDVARDATDTSTVPATLRPFARYNESDATVCRNFRLDRDNGSWVINGLAWDAARIDARPELDAMEIWTFENRSGEMHPMHVHLVQFQILDLDGEPPPPELAGWKDTVRVGSWDSARIIARFADRTGLYVYHCHKLEHEDHHMMGQFEVVAPGSGDGGSCGDGGSRWGS